MRDDVTGAGELVGDGRLMCIEPEQVIHGGKDILRVCVSAYGKTSLFVRLADDLSRADAGPEEHPPVGSCPVLAAAAGAVGKRRGAAMFADNHHECVIE